MPSAPGLLLGVAQNAYSEWSRLNPLRHGASVDDASRTFDAISQGMVAVTSGYGALESFVNEAIPRNQEYKRKTRKGKIERLDGKTVEENIGLDEKLREVIPQMLGVMGVDQHPDWQKWAIIRDLRHRLIHPTKEDVTHWEGGPETPNTIWARLLDPALPNPALVSRNLITFISQGHPPRWAEKLP